MDLSDATCPLCGAREQLPFLREKEFVYVRCRRCSMIYLSPRPDEASLRKHYQSYLPATPAQIEEWRILMASVFRRSARILFERHGGPGRLLDVGTGFGFFPRVMKDLQWDVEALEISETGAAHGESLGLEVRRQTLEEAAFPDQSFDVVTAFYVIEHLSDPATALTEMARILRPGGILLLRWPHTAPLASWTRLFRLDLLHAPSHLCQFTPRTLSRFLEEAGFVSIKTEVGGWTRPPSPLARGASALGGLLAHLLARVTGGRFLLPGVSKTTTAEKPRLE